LLLTTPGQIVEYTHGDKHEILASEQQNRFSVYCP
jgi:hypothetical protein